MRLFTYIRNIQQAIDDIIVKKNNNMQWVQK